MIIPVNVALTASQQLSRDQAVVNEHFEIDKYNVMMAGHHQLLLNDANLLVIRAKEASLAEERRLATAAAAIKIAKHL